MINFSWTIDINGVINTAMNGAILLVVTRYLGRGMDKIDRKNGKKDK